MCCVGSVVFFELVPLCLLNVLCSWMLGDLGCVCVCVGSDVSFVCCPLVWAPLSLLCMMLAPRFLVSVVMAPLLRCVFGVFVQLCYFDEECPCCCCLGWFPSACLWAGLMRIYLRS